MYHLNILGFGYLLEHFAGSRGRRVQAAAEHAELPPREHHREAVGRAGTLHHGARRRQERGLLPEERLTQTSLTIFASFQ